jgi:hypothetical protein
MNMRIGAPLTKKLARSQFVIPMDMGGGPVTHSGISATARSADIPLEEMPRHFVVFCNMVLVV